MKAGCRVPELSAMQQTPRAFQLGLRHLGPSIYASPVLEGPRHRQQHRQACRHTCRHPWGHWPIGRGEWRSVTRLHCACMPCVRSSI